MREYIQAGVRDALDITIMSASLLASLVANLGGEVNGVEPPKGDYIRTAA